MSTTTSTLDPYTANAENNNITPQEKINGLNSYCTLDLAYSLPHRSLRNRKVGKDWNAHYPFC